MPYVKPALFAVVTSFLFLAPVSASVQQEACMKQTDGSEKAAQNCACLIDKAKADPALASEIDAMWKLSSDEERAAQASPKVAEAMQACFGFTR